MNAPARVLMLAFLIFLLNFCGGKKDNIQEPPQKETHSQSIAASEENTDEELDEEESQEVVKAPKIKSVTFPEAPVAGKDFSVVVELEESDSETTIHYRWLVNSKEVPDLMENILSNDYFKGGDWIQCWVTAQRGNKTSSLTKSKLLKAKGAVPVIKVTRLEELTIPGTLKYKIEAFDPSIGENIESEDNAMTYELLEPLNAGIQLNQETGELSWEVDNETIEKRGTRIEIKFKVSSQQSQVVTSSIILNFTKESPGKKKPDEQKKEEKENGESS